MRRDTLVDYLDSYLEADRGSDYGPNGLQVEGAAEVRKVVTGVSACLELFERARQAAADTVLVHHGIFWRGRPLSLTGFQYRRVKALIDGNVNLIAYHLPLDRHGEVGNNAVAARALGLEELEPFGDHDGLPIGYRGSLPAPRPLDEILGRFRALYGQEPLVYPHGPNPLRRLAIVSGAAQSSLYEAIDQGLDLFVTGEVSEWVMNVAREAGIHYVAAGHYATERLGIQALGAHLAERFGLEVEFIDLPNQV